MKYDLDIFYEKDQLVVRNTSYGIGFGYINNNYREDYVTGKTPVKLTVINGKKKLEELHGIIQKCLENIAESERAASEEAAGGDKKIEEVSPGTESGKTKPRSKGKKERLVQSRSVSKRRKSSVSSPKR